MQPAGDVNNANISDMAALLDHADSDGLLRAFRKNRRIQKSRRRCTSSAARSQRETASRRHPMA